MAKGYSLDALVQEHYAKSVDSLGTKNINDMWGRDNVGTFPQNQNANATVANGYPAGAEAGNLEVLLTHAGTSDNCIQRYTNFGNLRMWIRSQDQGAGVRTWTPWRELINANNIYNAIYPIGIVLKFENATNPNNSFTGTVWEQIVDGRSVRAATSAEAGTTEGQIGSTGGSDTVTLAVPNIPGHTHGMQNHTHGIASHTHSMTHTHAIDHKHPLHNSTPNGAHSHAVTGRTTTNGNHTHAATFGNNANVSPVLFAGSNSGSVGTRNVEWAGDHYHDMDGTASESGVHFHQVDLPNFKGTSGGSSAANTGGTALTTGGPNNNTTTSTGSGTAFDVTNSVHYYALWKRVA
ncbi:tail fiber protein [Escherichia phage FXie-2024a]